MTSHHSYPFIVLMPAENSKNCLSDTNIKRYFEPTLTASGHCLWRLDKDGYLIDMSANIAQLSGHNLADIVSRHLVDFIIESQREAFSTLLECHQPFVNYPIVFLHKEDQSLCFEISGVPVMDEHQHFNGYQGVCINITEYKKMETQLRQSENNLANAQRIAQLGSWELDLSTNELFWSDEIYRILGKAPQSVPANYDEFMKIIHPDDFDKVTETISAGMVNGTYNIQYRIIQDKGMISILHARGEVIYEQGRPVRMVGTTQDITALKNAEQKINQLANYDVLTNLPNRATFNRQLEHSLTQAKRDNSLCALFCVGLDRFKLINESIGHEAGDELLLAVAKRLEQYIEDNEYIARLGGDEFALIKMNISHENTVAILAEKMIHHFISAFTIQEQALVISLSIGITLCPLKNYHSEDLLKDAQTAMHQAKLTGGNTYQFYSQAMTDKVKQRLSLEVDLRHALENQEFVLYYQPKVSTNTGKITGAEALIRWKHPRGELILPTQFVSILEDIGLIIPVSEWALEALCQQYSLWRERGFGDLSLSLNISAKQFVDKTLYEKIEKTLARFNCNHNFLELEVTESLLVDDVDSATLTLNKLHSLGVKLAIDDFGTGYSSLSYLKYLPVDTLKIDRTFVKGLPDNKQDAAITNVVIILAKSLGLSIVAEGVETKAQLDFLTEKSCDYVQGFYYSKALPHDEFIQLVQQERS